MNGNMKKYLGIIMPLIIVTIILGACSEKSKQNSGIHAPYYIEKPNEQEDNLVYSYAEYGSFPNEKIKDKQELEKIEELEFDKNDVTYFDKKKVKRILLNRGVGNDKHKEYSYYYYKPIMWKVIDVKDGEAILLSNQIIDIQQFDEKGNISKWEESSIRKYLNNEFIDIAFSSKEKKRLILSNVHNYSSDYGYPLEQMDERLIYDDTSDYVYLLSALDIDSVFFDCQYTFKGENEKYNLSALTDFFVTDASEYAKDLFDSYTGSLYNDVEMYGDNCLWWTRTLIDKSNYAICVDNSGTMDRDIEIKDDMYTNEITSYNGVRPIIRVNVKYLSALKISD